MIDEIHISNLALIEDADFVPSNGMTAITGETGAGKTALLSSCKLLMGSRASFDMVREGSEQAKVEGRFYFDGTEHVVVRSLTSDGRSRVKLDGQMASVSELVEAISPNIDLCSQHDQQLLGKPQMQRECLDAWMEMDASSDSASLVSAYRAAYQDVLDAQSRLCALKADLSASDAKVEDARFKLRQISAVNPTVEDYEELMAALRKSENAELLARTTGEASAAISEESGVLDGLNAAIALLEDGMRADETLSAMASSLREAIYIVEDVAHSLSGYADAFEYDVAEIDRMQERASAYQSLMRTYGPTVNDVLAVMAEAQAFIDAVDNSDEAVKKAEEETARAELALADAAIVLAKAREAAAPAFSKEVTQVMSDLMMGTAEFVCDVTRLPRESWTSETPVEVVFMFRPASGMQLRSLARIASGGELSRVMLAIHVVMGDRDKVPTLVFDEIDAGVGGAAALALGDVLQRLAHTHQVIVVTHLAQIAARADKQYVAKKLEDEGMASTELLVVEGNERVEEIARMLSGSLTTTSLDHARELLGL